MVPTLYGRQEIRVLSRDQMASLQQIGYVTAFGVCEHQTFGSFRLHTPQSGLFRFSARSKQIAWVLYGQASRAISIG